MMVLRRDLIRTTLDEMTEAIDATTRLDLHASFDDFRDGTDTLVLRPRAQ
jgi:hypothetical protein